MRHDVLVLLVGQRARLVQHLLAHADLADVMHVPTELDLGDGALVQPDLAREDRGVLRHPHRVTAGVGVLGVERFGDRLHAGQEDLFEPPRLLGDAHLEVQLVVPVLEHEPPPLHHLRDAGPHLLEVERLREVVHGPERQTAHGHFDIGDGRDEHDGGVGMPRAQLLEQLDPVHPRHAEVAQHQVCGLAVDQRQGLAAIGGLARHEPVGLHDAPQDLPEAQLVVDHQTPRRRCRRTPVRHPASCRMGATARGEDPPLAFAHSPSQYRSVT